MLARGKISDGRRRWVAVRRRLKPENVRGRSRYAAYLNIGNILYVFGMMGGGISNEPWAPFRFAAEFRHERNIRGFN